MGWSTNPTATDIPTKAKGTPVVALAIVLLVAVLSAVAFFQLGLLSNSVAIALPLLTLGLGLVVINSHWALCYVAFAITPFGIVQAEVVGVTLNLPEVLILLLVAKEAGQLLLNRPGFTPGIPWKSLIVFALTLTVAMATGIFRHNGIVNALQDFRQFAEFIALFWLVLQRSPNRDQVVQLATAYVFGATLVAIHGIIQHYYPIGMSRTEIAADLALYHSVRSGSFYGATPLGGLMVLAMGPTIGLALIAKKRSTQALLFVCLALCLVAMVFTKTRGAWVGALLSVAFLFLWIRPNKKILVGTGVAILLLVVAAGPTFLSRLVTLADPTQDVSLMERAQYYAAASHIADAHPLLGLGWGCYYDIDTILEAKEYVAVPRPESPEEATVHSAYLQIFVKTGLIGLGGFLLVMMVWVERVWRVYRSQPHEREDLALFAGLAAGLTGYLFHSTFENFFQWPVMSQSFWLFMALSFVAAIALGGTRTYRVLPLVLVTSGTLAFVLFMAASVRLETSHSNHYVQNIDRALKAGEPEKALRFAQRAAEVRKEDPLPYALSAEILLQLNREEEALQDLSLSVGIDEQPREPRKIDSGAVYYFAPARLLRGKLYAEAGDLPAALAQFELARGYADLTAPDFAEYHALLQETYARGGLWSRALDFGPVPTESRSVSEDTALGYALEGRADWKGLLDVATGLKTLDTENTDGAYLLGRALLSLERAPEAIAPLQQATDKGHSAAPYYFGLALVAGDAVPEAIEAFLQTPQESTFYPVALAHAVALQTTLDGGAAALRTRLNDALVGMTHVAPSDNNGPEAFQWRNHGTSHDGPAPVCLLWQSEAEGTGEIRGVSMENISAQDALYRIEGTNALLQLQWSSNRIVAPDLLSKLSLVGPMPGWVDVLHDWFGLRDGYNSDCIADASGVSGLRIQGLNWLYSVPTPTEGATGYLWTGAIEPGPGGAGIQLQTLGEAAMDVHNLPLLQREATGDPVSGAGFIEAEDGVEALRLVLSADYGTDSARFTGLGLLEISRPEMPQ